MSKVTIPIDSKDVVTLREVFTLALIQSETMLDDADECSAIVAPGSMMRYHNAVVSLMSRIDAMLPDSTGFFDCPLSGWAEDVLEDD